MLIKTSLFFSYPSKKGLKISCIFCNHQTATPQYPLPPMVGVCHFLCFLTDLCYICTSISTIVSSFFSLFLSLFHSFVLLFFHSLSPLPCCCLVPNLKPSLLPLCGAVPVLLPYHSPLMSYCLVPLIGLYGLW